MESEQLLRVVRLSMVASSMRGFQQSSLHLVSYMPVAVVQQYSAMGAQPTLPTGPIREDFPAAIGFVDISGFTALSEKLQQAEGRKGAELLSQYINAFFLQLIDQISEYGGDVIKFAGDALQVVWRAQVVERLEQLQALPEDSAGQQPSSPSPMEGALATPDDEVLADLVLTASRCCLHLLRTLDGFSPVPGVSLSLHMGIGAGTLSAFTLGGHEGKWEYFVAGEPIAQMADAAEGASSGELVISARANHLVHLALDRLSPAALQRTAPFKGRRPSVTRASLSSGEASGVAAKGAESHPPLDEDSEVIHGRRGEMMREMSTLLMTHEGPEERWLVTDHHKAEASTRAPASPGRSSQGAFSRLLAGDFNRSMPGNDIAAIIQSGDTSLEASATAAEATRESGVHTTGQEHAPRSSGAGEGEGSTQPARRPFWLGRSQHGSLSSLTSSRQPSQSSSRHSQMSSDDAEERSSSRPSRSSQVGASWPSPRTLLATAPNQKALLQTLSAFVPSIIESRMAHGQSGLWVSENRIIASVFFKLQYLGGTPCEVGAVGPAHEAVRIVQECTAANGGSILRLITDDKGTRFLNAFGLQGQVEEGYVGRALVSVLEASTRLAQVVTPEGHLPLGWSVGITTGKVLCGEPNPEPNPELNPGPGPWPSALGPRPLAWPSPSPSPSLSPSPSP